MALLAAHRSETAAKGEFARALAHGAGALPT